MVSQGHDSFDARMQKILVMLRPLPDIQAIRTSLINPSKSQNSLKSFN